LARVSVDHRRIGEPCQGYVAVRSAGRLDDIDTVRIDQWLHSVRLTKTRSLAAQACRGGHVKLNGKTAKPAAVVAPGDRIEAYLAGRQRIVEVTRLIAKRVGAAVAVDCYVDHSPPPPERDETVEPLFAVRERGAGRPTKRDRRQIDRLRGRRR
jgi:ribosome-associated heat shock protein Hsp15